jgi:hypothetical protein
MGLNNARRQARRRGKRDAEIEMLRKASASASQELSELWKEIEMLRWFARIRQQLPVVQAERDRLRQRVSDLETELVHERLLRKPQSVDPDQKVARLKATNRELRAKLREMRNFYEEQSQKRGVMAFSTYGKLMKCVHPDNTPSDADRREACALLSQWKQDRDRARRQAT